MNKKTAVVLDGKTLNPGDLDWSCLRDLVELRVYDETSPSELLERAEGAEILLSNKVVLDGEAIKALPKLQFISVLATGTNNIDLEAAHSRGIPVSNAPAYGTDAVAEFVLALMFELAKGVGAHSAAVADGEWSRREVWSFCLTGQSTLKDKVLGIVGMGRIGCRVAELASHLGMRVVAASGSRPQTPFPVDYLSIEELFATADFISLHCPLTPETQGLVHAGRLALAKESACLVNTARGGLVVEADLAHALRTKRIAAAAVDVLSTEPPTADHPLVGLPNCLITPHIAWSAKEARERLLAITEENVRAFLKGNPVHVVNG